MSELEALVKGVLVDLSGAGPLADWLSEHDRDKEAVLLRRRVKQWDKKRRRVMVEIAFVSERVALACNRHVDAVVFKQIFIDRRVIGPVDDSLRRYIRRKFGKKVVRKAADPHECRVGRSCTCLISGTEPAEDCPVHGGGGLPRCERCGRMMKWRSV